MPETVNLTESKDKNKAISIIFLIDENIRTVF